MPTVNTPHPTGLLHQTAVLERAAERMAERHASVYATETIRRLSTTTYRLLTDRARITTHLPTLAIRFATERLAASARYEGHLVTTTPEVLFVCVHNAGRSQMAAALLDHDAHGRAHVRSAGSAPANEINPAVVQAMA